MPKRSRLIRKGSKARKTRMKAVPQFEITRPLTQDETHTVLDGWNQGDAQVLEQSFVYEGKVYHDVPVKYEDEEPDREEVILRIKGKYYYGTYEPYGLGYWEFYLANKMGVKPVGSKSYFVEWTPDGSHWIVDPSQKFKTRIDAQKAADKFKGSMKGLSTKNVAMGGAVIPSTARVKEVVD